MRECNVTFENTNGQKVIVLLKLNKKGDLDWKIGFDPKIDSKTDLGLAGRFAEIFCKALCPEKDKTK